MYLSKSEKFQLKLLRSKTPQQRFYLMAELINSQFKIMFAGLKYTHPELDKKGLQKCLREQMIKTYSLKH